jgi:hypothetical protein
LLNVARKARLICVESALFCGEMAAWKMLLRKGGRWRGAEGEWPQKRPGKALRALAGPSLCQA